ncbi:unnamed protein product [Calicophoron daubneyi]|uniref:RWD domain-containing protein n=1 Tax=Calicophoron daubneyi TaxID=300641 RepID=A0AAV2T1M3_CALDB
MADPREEEREVLNSIYDSDELKISDDFLVQYRLGDHGDIKSFIVNITWPKGYPDVLPLISLESFYNAHVPESVKQMVIAELNSVAEPQLGMPMTFSLIDHLRENAEKYFKLMDSTETSVSTNPDRPVVPTEMENRPKCEKKEQLTKAQKRRQLNRTGQNGELPRGWNWISVVKHLQQTGACSQPSDNI